MLGCVRQVGGHSFRGATHQATIADSRRQLHLVYLPSCSIVRRWGHWWPLFESSPPVESQGSHAYAPSVCRHPKPRCVNMVHLPGVVRLQIPCQECICGKQCGFSALASAALCSRPTSGQRWANVTDPHDLFSGTTRALQQGRNSAAAGTVPLSQPVHRLAPAACNAARSSLTRTPPSPARHPSLSRPPVRSRSC